VSTTPYMHKCDKCGWFGPLKDWATRDLCCAFKSPMVTEIQVGAPVSTTELKARMSLLDPDFLQAMAKVMDFGTKKYAEEDWRDNPKVTVKGRMDSLGRHEAKINSAFESDIDSDHGESHFASIAVNAMICWWIAKNRPERDDRWKNKK